MADVLERAREAVREARLPDWVQDVRMRVDEDQTGELAVFITLLLRDDRAELVEDGDTWMDSSRRILDAFLEREILLWPYVSIVLASEAA